MSSVMTVREIAPGLHWLSACMVFSRPSDQFHIHASTYLIVGDDKALLIDAGHPRHQAAIIEQLDALLGTCSLDYVLPTHPEMPHAGGLPSIVERYPDVAIVGDTRDYRYYWPQVADNLVPMQAGEQIPLGGTVVTIVEAVIRDLPNTVWAYDERSNCLFVGDALAYSHGHGSGECVLLSEELPKVPSPEAIGVINDAALYFTRFVDLEPYFARLDETLDRYPVSMIAPAHGSVISNPGDIVPVIKEGMRAGQRSAREKLSPAPPPRAGAPGA